MKSHQLKNKKKIIVIIIIKLVGYSTQFFFLRKLLCDFTTNFKSMLQLVIRFAAQLKLLCFIQGIQTFIKIFIKIHVYAKRQT